MKKVIDILSRLWFVLFILACILMLVIGVAMGQTNEINQAKYLSETDQNQKAVAHLEKAIAVNPSAAALHYYLGVAQIKEGQLEAAANTFNKGIQLDEKEPLNYVGRGYISILNNNKDKAKIDFDKAVRVIERELLRQGDGFHAA